jgi:hypothetical protein
MANASHHLVRRALAAASLLLACGGESSVADCEPAFRPLNPSTVDVLGFTEEDVMAWATTERSLTGSWSSPSSDVSWNASGTVEATVKLTRGTGATQHVSSCGLSGLSIPAKLSFGTSDVALAETIETKLVATQKDHAELFAELSFENLTGTLEVVSTSAQVTLTQPHLRASLAPCGWSAHFTAYRERRTGAGISDEAMLPLLEIKPSAADCAVSTTEVPWW